MRSIKIVADSSANVLELKTIPFAAAQKLKNMIRDSLPQVTVQTHPCRGLCSYYAEKGGLLVGFEKL